MNARRLSYILREGDIRIQVYASGKAYTVNVLGGTGPNGEWFTQATFVKDTIEEALGALEAFYLEKARAERERLLTAAQRAEERYQALSPRYPIDGGSNE